MMASEITYLFVWLEHVLYIGHAAQVVGAPRRIQSLRAADIQCGHQSMIRERCSGFDGFELT